MVGKNVQSWLNADDVVERANKSLTGRLATQQSIKVDKDAIR